MNESIKKISLRDAFGDALVEIGASDERVVVLDADVSHSTKTITFKESFPERFFNIGIAEANMMNIAAGFASCGLIPFVSTFSFLACLRAGEQIRTSIAYPRLNVKIAGGFGGLSDSYDGATHQSVCDLAVVRSMPNMTVIVLADAEETRKAIPVIAQFNGPVFFRLSRAELPVIFNSDDEFEIGKGRLIKKGDDVTLIANGVMLARTIEAAESLIDRGINAGVIEIHTLKPIDEKILIEAAGITRAIVTIEEHNIIGGLGSSVAECLIKHCPVPMEMVGIQDTFAESGDYDELLAKYGMGVGDIIRAAEKVMKRKKHQERE